MPEQRKPHEENGREKHEHKPSLRETREKLPESLQALLPEHNFGYYEKTNSMHCDLDKPGGSKFVELANILEVLEKDAERIVAGVQKRQDDRQAFQEMGIDIAGFSPATKGAQDAENMSEALYYKVEGVKGRLGVIQLKELDPETRVIIHREKSMKNAEGKEMAYCSLSVVREHAEDMPTTDFATVIIGREGEGERRDELWTIHPGAPIRMVQKDFYPGSEDLPGPQEGVKQRAIIVRVQDILDDGNLTRNDYVKIIPGKEEEIFARFDV